MEDFELRSEWLEFWAGVWADSSGLMSIPSGVITSSLCSRMESFSDWLKLSWGGDWGSLWAWDV